MITRQQWLELIDYKITEGYQYINNHVTYNAWNYWDGDHDGFSIELVSDQSTHEPVSVEVFDYKNDCAYRRCVDGYAGDPVAWDNVSIVDLDTDEDFIEKATAIIAGEQYDTRVSIPVDLPDDIALVLMKQAHEMDITFNQLMENILKAKIADVLENQ